nr:MAG TPA: hypothetical protein [Caudoviricetes sp.]
MVKNAPVLEIEDFGSCGYDYRVDIQGEKTFGYLNHFSKSGWTLYFGSTPNEAAISDPVNYGGYTLSELKEELEFDLTNFYIRFGIHDCRYEL